MNSNRAFDDLRDALVALGLSRAYAERYAGELRDHHEDLVAEMSDLAPCEAAARAAGRLGRVNDLAGEAVRAYRRHTVMGRRPWLYFGLLPALATPVVTAVVFALMALCLADERMFQGRGIGDRSVRGLVIGCWAMGYVWPGLAGAVVSRAARRRALGWGWRVAGCATVVAWGACMRSSFHVQAGS